MVNFRKSAGLKYLFRGVCNIILTVVATACYGYMWIHYLNPMQWVMFRFAGNILMYFLYAMFTLLFNHLFSGFQIGVNRKSIVASSQAVAMILVNFVAIVYSSLAIGYMANVSYVHYFLTVAKYFLGVYICEMVLMVILDVLMIDLYRRLFPPHQILEIVGNYENNLSQKMNTRRDKYVVSAQISYDEELSSIEEKMMQYDAVLLNDIPSESKNQILKLCFKNNKRVYFTPKISDLMVKFSSEINMFDTPLYLNRNMGLTVGNRIFKRICDIVLSLIILILTSPFTIITAILIHLEDGGPVFFRQERVTLGGKRFMILKFRSMIVNAEEAGKSNPASSDDDRITKVGRVIRATRIDELPQLINILKGDMSLIGPRPERVEHVEKYTEDIPEFAFRHVVKGGLTGYAQVYGKYNTSALDKLKMDLTYIMNYSPLMDIQILVETVKVVFRKESTEGFTDEQKSKIVENDQQD